IMKSMIEEIYYGRRGHNETIVNNCTYNKQLDKINKLIEEFLLTLNEKQKAAFDKIMCADMGLEAETAFTHYEEGFKIGLLLGIEAGG
ncbi:MAG: hypothetical protein K2J83_04740, partial [Clostridia bacterium]|nr:hypothetical protein [Clostridia bacterium]